MIGVGRTIKDSNGVGFEFDYELLDDVIDNFFACGDFDGSVVFVCR
jgi:hypothetical protein